MRMQRKYAELAVAVACFGVWLADSAKPAYGYTDPGTGLMAIQIVGSTVAGFVLLARKRVFDLFARLRRMARRDRR